MRPERHDGALVPAAAGRRRERGFRIGLFAAGAAGGWIRAAVTVDPFRAPKGVPLWLPPAILGAVALGLCAALASEDTPFMDLRPLMYVAIAVVWVGASAAWLTLASLIRAERTRQALEADDDVASAAAPRSSPVSSSFEPARARPSGFGLLGVYLALSFALFCALP